MKKLLFCAVCIWGCHFSRDGGGESVAYASQALSIFSGREMDSIPDAHRIYDSAAAFYEHTLVPAGFNGGMLVAYQGKIIFEKYKGLERLGSGNTVDSNTSFHLASTSKTFTAMAVLKLQEQGHLNIQSLVSDHLSGFPFPGVRIIDLLTHRSGIPNYVNFMQKLGWDTKRILTNRKLLEFLIAKKRSIPNKRPNTFFEYSNTNYALLALIVEHASGLTYSEYLKQQFFIPLGMNGTYVFDLKMADSSVPSFDQRGKLIPFNWLDAVYGDKNVYSTTRDLLRWDRALTEGGLFQQETMDAAAKPYSHEKPGVRNYGLGWRLVDYPQGSRLVFHNGWWHGNNIVFGRLPKDGATVIVLGNRYTRMIYEASRLYACILGIESQPEVDP